MVIYPPSEQQFQQAAASYFSENEELKPLLDFYEQVYNEQRRAVLDIQPLTSNPKKPTESMYPNFPLLHMDAVSIPAAETAALAERITGHACLYLLNEKKETPSSAKTIADAVSLLVTEEHVCEVFSKPANLSIQVLQSFIAENCTQLPLNDTRLMTTALIIRLALQAAYVAYARQMQALYDFSLWDKGVCPVCGEPPVIALLQKDDGKKVLECGLCHTRWNYPRIKCCECGNNKQEELGFFYQADHEHRRVYFCKDCKFYLKTVVLKDTNRLVIPDLENEATLYLDVLAQKEGFRYYHQLSESTLN